MRTRRVLTAAAARSTLLHGLRVPHGLFGTTLLDFEVARGHERAARGVEYYGVLPASVTGLSDGAVEATLDKLAKDAPQRLASVPDACRSALEERLTAYLADARGARSVRSPAFRLDYGASFWKVLVRHPPAA